MEMSVAQKRFDKDSQATKRLYWKSALEELLQICNKGKGEFWKKIGSIGVAQERN